MVNGDELSSNDRLRRLDLQSYSHPFVLAVPTENYVWQSWRSRRMQTLVATLPAGVRTRLSADDRAKGPRWDDRD
jgi:hypothetical protein